MGFPFEPGYRYAAESTRSAKVMSPRPFVLPRSLFQDVVLGVLRTPFWGDAKHPSSCRDLFSLLSSPHAVAVATNVDPHPGNSLALHVQAVKGASTERGAVSSLWP